MKNEKLKCGICGGDLEDKTITHSQEWEGELVIFEDVPAKVCKECGEGYISAETSKEIFKALQSKSKPQKIKEVPVWNYDMIAKAS